MSYINHFNKGKELLEQCNNLHRRNLNYLEMIYILKYAKLVDLLILIHYFNFLILFYTLNSFVFSPTNFRDLSKLGGDIPKKFIVIIYKNYILSNINLKV